jgi:glycosyltransferase involved in cell wall biosynthesis
VAGRRHIVVPYPATNSTVRTRALHWVARAVATEHVDRATVVVHGPGFERSRVPSGEPLLLVRNARRVTRGRREAGLLRAADLGVYDIDDGLPWDDGRLPGLGRWWKRPFPRSLLARRCAAAADRVIAGNDVLAAWAADLCHDVRIVPTCVEPTDYEVRADCSFGESGPVLGWIGSAATEHYLIDIAPALAAAHRRFDARLVMISNDGPVPAQLASFTVKRVWQPTSPREIASWDIGLMPLRDGVYERAKCGYKLLQYAASGVPVIGSPVGVNRSLLTGMDGLAPESADDWADALTTLIEESATRRQQRARRGLEVAAAYSYEAWQDRWLDAVGW